MQHTVCNFRDKGCWVFLAKRSQVTSFEQVWARRALKAKVGSDFEIACFAEGVQVANLLSERTLVFFRGLAYNQFGGWPML